jgi:PAS domain S-box-containing protein
MNESQSERQRKRQSSPESCPDWYDTILESIADGVFTVDKSWRITYFNRAAEKITGLSRKDVLGRYCWEVFHASICESGCALRQTMESGSEEVNRSAYIVRNDGSRLPVTISTALLRNEQGEVVGGVETFRSVSEVETLRKELRQSYTFCDIVSKSSKMREILDILPQAAGSDSTIVLEGESGTGKELFARAIHSLSGRRDGPLVTVNCAALPDTLLESELFGHVAGAFTDARKDRAGRFQQADGGTLFLDEIGEISSKLQVGLLRVIEQKSFQPLGSSETVEVDVRLVAATNKRLAKLVDQGSFRRDLFYRLNVITFTLPSLRERPEDVPLLVDHFIERFNRIQGRQITGASPEALSMLVSYSFPGNVRELANVIERAFILCTGERILPGHLPPRVRRLSGRGEGASYGVSAVEEREGTGGPFGGEGRLGAMESNEEPKEARNMFGRASLEEAEARVIRRALLHNNGNKAATARELGVHKTTLWRKMKRLGIPLETGSGSESSKGSTSEGSTSEGSTSEGSTSERSTSKGSTSEGSTSERSTSDEPG